MKVRETSWGEMGSTVYFLYCAMGGFRSQLDPH
jgi:hypothetical protein